MNRTIQPVVKGRCRAAAVVNGHRNVLPGPTGCQRNAPIEGKIRVLATGAAAVAVAAVAVAAAVGAAVGAALVAFGSRVEQARDRVISLAHQALKTLVRANVRAVADCTRQFRPLEPKTVLAHRMLEHLCGLLFVIVVIVVIVAAALKRAAMRTALPLLLLLHPFSFTNTLPQYRNA